MEIPQRGVKANDVRKGKTKTKKSKNKINKIK